MELENCVDSEGSQGLSSMLDKTKTSKGKDYLPFGSQYFEDPKPIGQVSGDILAYTSATFCTFKFIPLIDDGD